MERPIIFSGDMMRAILEGYKTQTRRVTGLGDVMAYPGMLDGKCELGWLGYKGFITSEYFLKYRCKLDYKHNPGLYHWFLGQQVEKREINPIPVKCPFGCPGDMLWVRETWIPNYYTDGKPGYPADLLYTYGDMTKGVKLSPSIHMPRWASRLTLKIHNIHAERLQEISEDDAWAEGVGDGQLGRFDINGIVLFKSTWDKLYQKYDYLYKGNHYYYSWSFNPWVWVIEFEKVS